MWEQTLLRQWGNIEKAPAGAGTAAARENTEKAPAGADTTAAVGKYRESSCGSGHCSVSASEELSSEEKQLGGLCGREGGGGGGGGGGDGEERLLWGFGGVF